MGPTNLALVKLFDADRDLRAVQSELDDVTRSVRILGRKIADLDERLRLAHTRHLELQAQYKALELELKTRDAHIEKLRTAQQATRNNREYQALLVEISTQKVDRTKVEEQALRLLEQIERVGAEVAGLSTQVAGEKQKLADAEAQIGDRVAELQARIEQARPVRDAAAVGIPRDVLEQFNRLADRYDGEAMASITKPHPRREEYSCSACNMDIVPDIYNRLHTRDIVVHCPSCRRILFIPDDLPPELAINKGGGTGKPAATRVRRKTKAEVANKGNISTPPVLSKWDELVTKAQGESVRAAVEADHAPVVGRVEINGELVGEFKGKTLDHLSRCISLILSENGFTADVKVTPAAGPVASSSPTDGSTSGGAAASSAAASSAAAAATFSHAPTLTAAPTAANASTVADASSGPDEDAAGRSPQADAVDDAPASSRP
jgi:predicted  nucleic acid-binding Zn-ribbon protein